MAFSLKHWAWLVNMSFSPFSKTVAKVFLFTVCLLALLILIIPTNFGVKTALSIADNFVEMEYGDVEGSLYSTLSVNNFSLEAGGVSVAINNVNLDLSIRELFDLNIKLTSVDLDEVAVVLDAEQAPSESAPSNEYIALPVQIAIGQLSINSFVFEQSGNAQLSFYSFLLEQLTLNESQLTADAILFNEIAFYSQDTEKQDSTGLNTQKLLNSLNQAPSIEIPQIFVPLDISLKSLGIGQLVQVAGDREKTALLSNVESSIEIKEQKVELTFSTFANALLTGTRVAINSKVDLANKFNHTADFQLQHNDQLLTGVIAGDLYNQHLKISDGVNTLANLRLSSEIDQADLPIALALEVFDLSSVFDFANQESPDATLERMNFVLEGNWEAGYSLTSKGDIKYISQKGNEELASLNGNMLIKPADLAILVDDFQVNGELGSVQINGQSEFAQETNELAWGSEYSVRIAQFYAQNLYSDLPELIEGNVLFSSVIKSDSIAAKLNCENLRATLDETDISVECNLELSDKGSLSINNATLNFGDNVLISSGTVDLPDPAIWNYSNNWLPQIDSNLKVDITANDIAQIYKDMSGKLQFNADINGKLMKPYVDAIASASALNYKDISLDQLTLSINTAGDQNWQTGLQVSLDNLLLNNQEVSSASLLLEGDMEQQALDLDVKAEEWSVKQTFSTLVTDIESFNLQGEWLQGLVRFKDYELIKDKNTQFSIKPKLQEATVAGHCWKEEKANLEFCTQNLNYINEGVDIDTTLFLNAGVVLNEIRPDLFKLASELPVKSTLKGRYSSNEGINLLSANLVQGKLVTTNHVLDISAIVANLNLNKNVLNTVLYAGTEDTGRIGLSSSLNLGTETYQHKGSLSVNDLQLSLLRRFAPAINTLQGNVNAGVKFEGEITSPDLYGELNIEDGELTLDAYTYPLTGFRQQVVFDKKAAMTDGRFNLGDGSADFSAKLDFSSGLSVLGGIEGNGLEIAYQNYDLRTSPKIDFSMTPELIDVDGVINIDRTNIKIDSLPETIRSPSSDVIVIGQEPPPPLVPIGLDIDLQVQVDPEEKETVNIDALGLKASLSGDLNLSVTQEKSSDENTFQPMQTYLNGYLNVLSGSYDAWGQALQIQTGSIYFNGEPTLPEFDVSAIRNPLNTQGDVIAGVRVTGNPILPKIELFSEPAMEQARQLSYLLQGQDLGGSSGGDNSAQLLNLLVSFGVSRNENRVSRAGRALGFESLNLQTAGQGDSTQVQLTGRISEDLQITYSVGIEDAASEVILKYQLLPQLYVEATNGVNNALDLFYEFSRGRVVSEVPTSPAIPQ